MGFPWAESTVSSLFRNVAILGQILLQSVGFKRLLTDFIRPLLIALSLTNASNPNSKVVKPGWIFQTVFLLLCQEIVKRGPNSFLVRLLSLTHNCQYSRMTKLSVAPQIFFFFGTQVLLETFPAFWSLPGGSR